MDCTDKLAFETKEAAVAAMLAAEYLHDNRGGLTVYQCQLCGLFHFSTS
ncbi:hypothetical protein KC878_03740 [Candidatus Saccharibacteria bacterium]|nr:hypothetical protein [Candidatus Saccharibacteria bacterium]